MRVLPVPFFFQKEILVDFASLGGSEVASAFVSIFEIFSKHVRQDTGVGSYVQKHVIDALEGFSQFLAKLGKAF